MEKTRYKRCDDILIKLAEVQRSQTLKGVESLSPDLGKMISEFAFGEIYSGPVFDLKQRELITLSSLITQGAEEELLQVSFKCALSIGMTFEELMEVVIHCAVYAGFPNALKALSILKKVSDHEYLKTS